MSASRGSDRPNPWATGTPPAVVWHDLECGRYRADLPLWRALAARYTGPILDVGAGTGRVALELARAGHSVTALDCDAVLLGALNDRAAGATVETVCADARSFELSGREFGLCVVPMQTVQLLGGTAGRVAFLRRAHAHLRRDGLLACAILSALEPFDCANGEIGPSAETARVDGMLYASTPTRVGVLERTVVIERERRVLAQAARAGIAREGPSPREGTAERDVIELDRLSASQLEREAIGVGLRPEDALQVAPTQDHAGSVVVMLRA